jgi:hypothetical protein
LSATGFAANTMSGRGALKGRQHVPKARISDTHGRGYLSTSLLLRFHRNSNQVKTHNASTPTTPPTIPPIAPPDNPFFVTVVDPSVFEDDMTEPPVTAAVADDAVEDPEEELIELDAMEEDDDDGIADELDDAALEAAARDCVELPCD